MYEDYDYYEFLDACEDSWVDPMEQEHLWDGFYPEEIDPPF